MLSLIVFMGVQAEQVVVRAVEPRPATPWVEVFSGGCGRQNVEIRRPMRPLSDGPQVLINGQPAGGDVAPLTSAFSEVGAAYRMSFQCSPTDDTTYLRWVSGLAGDGGQVRYRSGSATFKDGALVESRSEDVDADAFWYR